MSGIRLENQREVLIPFTSFPTGADPADIGDVSVIRQPTADKEFASAVMPCNGHVKAAVFIVAVAGAAGNSVDLKEEYWVINGGIAGAGTTRITEIIEAMDLNEAPDNIPAAGTKLVSIAISPKPVVKIGDVLYAHFETTGTLGTATRPRVTPVGVIIVADGNVDPSHPLNQR